VTFRKSSVLRALSAAALVMATSSIFAHGDVTPQAVDTSSLPAVGTEWQAKNPYLGNKEAIRIGGSAFNQNCARCHGLGAVSGGIAPDLRYLPTGQEGDEIFLNRIRHGATRDGRVYMPPFEGILSQEAMWTIRSWLETVRVDD
jgi:cytochrome c-550 PedF